MFAKTYGATTLGVDGVIIDVEVDASNGLPSFDLVGLPDPSVKEAKERVRTAIKNSGIQISPGKVTINLAPAGIRKDSSGLDLPIAIGLLAANGLIEQKKLEKCIFAAELSLEGHLKSIAGILSMAVKSKEMGFTSIFVSPGNSNEALLVDGIEVFAPKDLAQLLAHFTGVQSIEAVVCQGENSESGLDADSYSDDFADVQGQYFAKRALEIAAAGGHNVLMVGSPGSGKTMLARRMSSILPTLTREEALEVTKIYSISGMLTENSGLIHCRPFRSPHHTTSASAMIGGGSIPRPGEVTLAHHGVLFLDELPEFGKSSLEALRQPLEDHIVTIARVNATITYPSDIMLIAALNPCPCGYFGDSSHNCECSPGEIKRYQRKISGPLLDRIDIHIHVPCVAYKEMVSEKKEEASAKIRERVVAARNIQLKRFKGKHIFCNSQMNHMMIREFCSLEPQAAMLLEQVFKKRGLSARSYDRIVKVARTIADLASSSVIREEHVAEAVQLRELEHGTI